MADDVIKIQFTLEKKDTDKSFNHLEKKAGTAGGKAGKNFAGEFRVNSNKAFSGIGADLTKRLLGVFAATQAIRAISSAFKSGFNSSRDFSRGIAEVNSILGKNKKVTDEQAESLKSFASQFGTSTSQQAKAYYQTISAGITDSSKAMRVLGQSNKLAVAGISDLNSTLNVLTDIINVYGGAVGSASDITDTLFTTVRLGKTTVPELAANLGAVVSIAKTAGVGFTPLNAALATLTTQGQTTAERVTQLKSLFNAFAKRQKEVAKFTDLSAIATKGLSGVLDDLRKNADAAGVPLINIVGRSEAVQAILGLTGDAANKFSDTLIEMQNTLGATKDALGEVRKSADIKISLATNQLKLLAETIVGSALPAIGSLAEVLSESLELSAINSNDAKSVVVYARQIELLEKTQSTLNDQLKNTGSGLRTLWNDFDNVAGQANNVTKAILAARQSMIQLQNQVIIPNSQTEQLLGAERRLKSLKEELKSVDAISNALGVTFTNLSNRSAIDIKSNIQEEIKNIENLENSLKKSANARLGIESKTLFSLAELRKSFGDQFDSETTRKLVALQQDGVKRKALLDGNLKENQISQEKHNVLTASLTRDLAMKQEQILKESNQKILLTLGDNFKLISQKAKETGVQIGGALSGSLSNAIEKMATSLEQGKSIFDDFGSFIGAAIGDLMSTIGKSFIATGVGMLAIQGLSGGEAIAAGAGLLALGSIMKSKFGGGSSSSASGGGGAGGGGGGFAESGSFDQNAPVNEPTTETTGASTNVVVNVQGDILDSEESGARIVTLLNDAFDKQGVVINSKGIA